MHVRNINNMKGSRMNRREFMQNMGLGILGAIVIPFPVIIKKKWHEKGYYGPLTAEQFMTKAYNDYCRGTSRKYRPDTIVASNKLYEDYEGGLMCMQRFVDVAPSGPKTLMFKASRVYPWTHEKWNRMDQDWTLIISGDIGRVDNAKMYHISNFGWPV